MKLFVSRDGSSLDTFENEIEVLFFVEKGPAADATDAPQPQGLLCNPVMKMKRKMISFFFK
jgi:hypothetical protein